MSKYTGVLALGGLALIGLVLATIGVHWLVYPACILGGALITPVVRWYAEILSE